MSKIAVAYLRDFKGNMASIDVQLERCQKIAREKNMTIVGIYSDYENFNSFTRREKMILDSESRRFQYVILPSLTCLSRDQESFYEVVERLKNNGVQLSEFEGVVGAHLLEMSARLYRYDQNAIHERENQELLDSCHHDAYSA